MEFSAKIVNDSQSLTLFTKSQLSNSKSTFGNVDLNANQKNSMDDIFLHTWSSYLIGNLYADVA